MDPIGNASHHLTGFCLGFQLLDVMKKLLQGVPAVEEQQLVRVGVTHLASGVVASVGKFTDGNGPPLGFRTGERTVDGVEFSWLTVIFHDISLEL